MTPAPPTQLWNRNFILWWLGSAQSAFGSALAGIALSFLVLHQTGSAGAMGVNLALALLPALLSPLFGTLADRLPIGPPLIIGNLLRGGIQLGIGIAALTGEVPVIMIYIATFLTGLMTAFASAASLGMVARLVPATDLTRATGLLQGATQTLTMLGLMGGGVLIARVGRGGALILDGVGFFLFALLLLWVRFPVRKERIQVTEGFGTSLLAGWRYLRGQPLLMALPLIALVLNASFAPLEMLLPKRMEALGAGVLGYGLFFGLLLGGMAGGSFVAAALGPRLNPALTTVGGMAAMGMFTLALSLTRSAPPMYALALATGLASACCNTGLNVLFQRRVDPAYYGRVGSLLGAVGIAGMPLTLLLLAPVADRVPLTAILAVAGSVTLLCAAVWGTLLRRESKANAPATAPV